MMPRGDASAAEDVFELDGSRVSTRWIDAETLCATYSGRASQALVAEGERRFWRVAGDSVVRFALVDAGAVIGIDGGAANVGRRWMTRFKTQGGQLITVVATSGTLRMVVASILFASGAPVRIVGSRAEALALIAQESARTTAGSTR